MRNVLTISTLILTGALYAAAPVDLSMADETLTRSELCGKLQLQTQQAITEHAESTSTQGNKVLCKQQAGTRHQNVRTSVETARCAAD